VNISITQSTNSRRSLNNFVGHNLVIGLQLHLVLAVSNIEQKIGGNALCWAMTKAMTNARGPREPWHNLHCKIEGQAACDILTHIKQHWRKARWWHTTDVIQFKRIQWILSPSANILPEGHPKLYMTNYNEP
jgi:phosphatidylserine/phosphatidylglycerophosphate/cardiolipin synthase-like enzyme